MTQNKDELLKTEKCGLIILGSGPAGLTAGIYSARAGLDVRLIDPKFPGGQVANSYEVENYPGFISVTGTELAESFLLHAKHYGISVISKKIKSLDISGNEKRVLCRGTEFIADAIIIAIGTVRRKLGIPGESEFIGHGVSYCAACDGNFFKGKTVSVVGGGNTAIEDALYLANICEKVYIIHRRDMFRADKVLCERADKTENIEILYNTVPIGIYGKKTVSGIKIKSNSGINEHDLATDAVFAAIGSEPDTSLFPESLNKDKSGYIETDSYMKTNIPGVFAAGDIRDTVLRQIVTAASDGAVAATSAVKYIEEVRSKNKYDN